RDGQAPARTSHTAVAKYLSGETARPGERSLSLLLDALSEVARRRVSSDEIGYPGVEPESAGGGGFESPSAVIARLQTITKVATDEATVELTEQGIEFVASQYGARGAGATAAEIIVIRQQVHRLLNGSNHPP